ncbi:MAG: plasmid pRiA4b ORF-3 family protein, partial [Candidatus Margulisiibacteriota bacterium]
PIKDYFKKEKDKVMYVYDYGDGWQHEVLLEKILIKNGKVKYPICADGQLACPPEDCGSIPGYYECIEAVKNKDNSEGLIDWIGDWRLDDFDPKKIVFTEPKKRFKNSA